MNNNNPYQKSFRASTNIIPERKIIPETKLNPSNSDHFNTIQRQGKLSNYFSNEESPIASTNTHSKVRKRIQNQQISRMSVSDINMELETNTNDILFLINRRKQLVSQKKRRMKEQYQERARGQYTNEFDDQQMEKLSCFTKNPQSSQIILSQIIQIIPHLDQMKVDQQQKSNAFWDNNQKFEYQIDILLNKLKQIDSNLQKQTNEVAELCRNLDSLQDSLKELLIKKSDDHLRKAQPLFTSKKKTYDLLNQKIYERQRIKDQKIEYIKRIKQLLGQLKILRQNRLKQIHQLFNIEDPYSSQNKISNYNKCVDAFEELLKIKQKYLDLDTNQKSIVADIQILVKSQENLISDIIKKQSDETKAYQQYHILLTQKLKYGMVLGLFGHEIQQIEQKQLNSQQLIRKYKEFKQILRSMSEEDRALKLGLSKTIETSKTFTNILKSIQNEKDRRKQLLNLLDMCTRLKQEEETKKEQLRNLNVEVAKKNQLKNHIEDDLENILSDGDLESYKKLGSALHKCENDIEILITNIKDLELQIEGINRQMIAIVSNLKHEYEDILKDILPQNFEYNLKSSEEIKQVKNYIRKTYKRLGLISVKDQ